MTSADSRTFAVRHVQLARAAFAAIAALMITFSSDHSALVGSAVFSGFAIATGLVLLLSVWLVYPAGRRWPAAALGGVTVVAGMASGLYPLRTVAGYFTIVIAWALISGVIELIAGWRGLAGRRTRREIAPGVADARPAAPVGPRSESRDAAVVGAITALLGIALLFVQPAYALRLHDRRGERDVHPHRHHDRRRPVRRLRGDRRGVPRHRRLLAAPRRAGHGRERHGGGTRIRRPHPAEGLRVSHDSPTRRDLMKPVQLLGLAFGAALFAGVVTLVSMGFFQQRTADEAQRAIVTALVVAGVSFIAVLLIVSLLLLAVDPAQVAKQIDRPVLFDDESESRSRARTGCRGIRRPEGLTAPVPRSRSSERAEARPRDRTRWSAASSSTSFDARPSYVAGVSASRRSFASSPMSRPAHELGELGRADAAAAREVLEERVGVADLRAAGGDLGAHHRLDRLGEHLPVGVEVGQQHVLGQRDLARARAAGCRARAARARTRRRCCAASWSRSGRAACGS